MVLGLPAPVVLVMRVLGLLGWSPTLIPATHWSSLGSKGTNESSRLLRLYDSPQLVELVARKYRDDVRLRQSNPRHAFAPRARDC